MNLAQMAIEFALNPKGHPIQLDGDGIVAQIDPRLRGEISKRWRRPDVRVLLRTANTGTEHEFINHGHPDNEVSKVLYNGGNAIVIMPSGIKAQAQVTAARQIIRGVKRAGLEAGVTPEFIQAAIVNKRGALHRFADQIYGPAPFDGQAAKFVDVEIKDPNGKKMIVQPDKQDGYAAGMRDWTQEEAWLVTCEASPREMFIKAGSQAATAMSRITQSTNVKLDALTYSGGRTALEKFDGFGMVNVGLVLAIDGNSGNVKPIKLETARQIFDVASLHEIRVTKTGAITHQFLNVGAVPTGTTLSF